MNKLEKMVIDIKDKYLKASIETRILVGKVMTGEIKIKGDEHK